MQQGCAFWCLADAPRGSISQPALLNSSVVLGLALELQPEILDWLLKEPRGGGDECRLASEDHRVVDVEDGKETDRGVAGAVHQDRNERGERDQGHDGGEEPPFSVHDDREKGEHEGEAPGVGEGTRGTTCVTIIAEKRPFVNAKERFSWLALDNFTVYNTSPM